MRWADFPADEDLPRDARQGSGVVVTGHPHAQFSFDIYGTHSFKFENDSRFNRILPQNLATLGEYLTRAAEEIPEKPTFFHACDARVSTEQRQETHPDLPESDSGKTENQLLNERARLLFGEERAYVGKTSTTLTIAALNLGNLSRKPTFPGQSETSRKRTAILPHMEHAYQVVLEDRNCHAFTLCEADGLQNKGRPRHH